MRKNKTVHHVFSAVVLTIAVLSLPPLATRNDVWGQTTTTALDPGPRVGGVTTGNPPATLTPAQLLYFQDGLSRFLALDSVSGTALGETDSGLGPGYNSNSCGSCHAQPATGGSSPVSNPQFTAAFDDGATNTIPSFIAQDGPVREARFPFKMNSAGVVSMMSETAESTTCSPSPGAPTRRAVPRRNRTSHRRSRPATSSTASLRRFLGHA
jgi:hypothetical protein